MLQIVMERPATAGPKSNLRPVGALSTKDIVFRVEIVRASIEAGLATARWVHKLAPMISLDAVGLHGEQGDMQRIAGSELALICGENIMDTCKAAQAIRRARLSMPLVACTQARDPDAFAQMLYAGFDDVLCIDQDIREIRARIAGLYDRHIDYRLHSEMGGRSSETACGAPLLSPREQTLLRTLKDSRGRLCPYDDLLEAIDRVSTDRAIRQLHIMISGLRRKVPSNWRINSVKLRGYVLELPSARLGGR